VFVLHDLKQFRSQSIATGYALPWWVFGTRFVYVDIWSTIMSPKASELKLVFDVLLDEMFASLSFLRRQQNRTTDIREAEFVAALGRYETTRLRWLIALDDLRSCHCSPAQALKVVHLRDVPEIPKS
jgi:hypothetical protein